MKKGDILAAYDNKIGIVYQPRKGKVKTTTPEHAKAIQEALEQYFDNKLAESDSRQLEEYIEKQFEGCEELPVRSMPNLLETDSLYRLEIMLANDCNLNCRYCYAKGGSYRQKAQHLKPETALEYLEKLLVGTYRKIHVVMFFGGESTLCPDTIEAVCDFFEKNTAIGIFQNMPKFTMVSNATLIDEKMAKIIAKYQIRVTVSVDGPQQVNDCLRIDRAGNGTYKRIERGIQNLKEQGTAPAMIETTYTTLHQQMGYTRDEVRDFLCSEFGVEKVLVADCGHGGDESLVIENGRDVWDSDQFSDGKIRFASRLSKKYFSDITCGAGTESFILLPNGDLFPCHFFVGHKEYQIACYKDGQFDFTKYSEVLERLQKAHKLQNEKCSECWAKELCRACPASMLLHENGDGMSCHAERQWQEKIVLDYAGSHSASSVQE